MSQTQIAKKYGADNSIYDVKEDAKVQLSSFNFSRKTTTTFDIGQIIPIDWFRVFPRDEVTVNIRYLLETLPLAVPPMTNYRVRIHAYSIKNSGCWKGWNSFISRGRKGQVSVKKLPSIPSSYIKSKVSPASLSAYLGLPVDSYFTDTNGVASNVPQYLPAPDAEFGVTQGTVHIHTVPNRHIPVNGVSALPYLFYQKIYRFSFLNPNLLQDNEVWFPEDLADEWRLDYLGNNLNSSAQFVPESATMPTTDQSFHFIPSVTDNCINITELRYASFENDYFTTAKPWLVRGEERGLETDITGISGSLDFSESVASFSAPGDNAVLIAEHGDNYYLKSTYGSGHLIANALNRGKVRVTGAAKSTFTANKLRELLAYSVWQERNALTNGSYNEYIKSHFNVSPNSPDYEPYYLGGVSTVINFAQVLQSSSSTENSPLGTQAGLGQANGSDRLFKFRFKDYGMVMLVMFVTPEIYYTQGVGHEWTDLQAEKWFVPEDANLGYEPILNQEIYPQGTADDEGLFGYQTREAYLKARQNRVSGQLAIPNSVDRLFGSYVQSREFNVLPKLSLQFVTASPQNIDRSFLAYKNYPAFRLQFATDVKLTRALPYSSTPNTFGF